MRAEAAERQAKRLVRKDETYTIERFTAACGRCRSRQYSDPSEPPRTTRAELATLALEGNKRGTLLVTGAAGNVGRSAVFAAKEKGATVIAGVRKGQIEEARALGADRVLALDDDAAVAGLELLDAIADTVMG